MSYRNEYQAELAEIKKRQLRERRDLNEAFVRVYPGEGYYLRSFRPCTDYSVSSVDREMCVFFKNVNDRLVPVGHLERIETEEMVVGHTFDFTTNQLTPNTAPTPPRPKEARWPVT